VQWIPADELAHSTRVEEWTFSCWAADGSLGLVTGYRLVGGHQAWYWWAVARRDEPLLHVTEFDIPRRSNPLLAKAEAMWAEMVCESPFAQWTVGNETYAVALDDPDEALGRAYGEAMPVAMDLEWYATRQTESLPVLRPSSPASPDLDSPARRSRQASEVTGYQQSGTVHGRIELATGSIELVELAAHRTHRWTSGNMAPHVYPAALAHFGLRAPFRLPDNSVIDLVLTPAGWRCRASRGSVGENE
jgi:hypothetical protein